MVWKLGKRERKDSVALAKGHVLSLVFLDILFLLCEMGDYVEPPNHSKDGGKLRECLEQRWDEAEKQPESESAKPGTVEVLVAYIAELVQQEVVQVTAAHDSIKYTFCDNRCGAKTFTTVELVTALMKGSLRMDVMAETQAWKNISDSWKGNAFEATNFWRRSEEERKRPRKSAQVAGESVEEASCDDSAPSDADSTRDAIPPPGDPPQHPTNPPAATLTALTWLRTTSSSCRK